MQESPIFTRTYDLLKWLIPTTLKFPKSQRFVMAQRVRDTALGFQDLQIAAAFSQDKAPILVQADIELQKLRFHLRLCFDFRLINPGQYEHVSRMVAEIGRLLGGWRKKAEAGIAPE